MAWLEGEHLPVGATAYFLPDALPCIEDFKGHTWRLTDKAINKASNSLLMEQICLGTFIQC